MRLLLPDEELLEGEGDRLERRLGRWRCFSRETDFDLERVLRLFVGVGCRRTGFCEERSSFAAFGITTVRG